MNIKCLVLYGSCARGDQNTSSDIDLFAIHDQDEYRMYINGNINIALYSEKKAFEIMESGNLFGLHIKEEGKLMFNDSIFNEMRASFKYKDSYSEEISVASTLGRFILKEQKIIKNSALLNKRLSWCVRTILIAKSAEMKEPVFSKFDISKKFSCLKVSESVISSLIDLKKVTTKDEKMVNLSTVFFEHFSPIDEYNNIPIDSNYFLRKTVSKLLSDKNCSVYNY
ncbi:Nucleotidyltransferase domain [Serratia plymuthica]|uniref:anti-phage Hailong system nucleotidyltransferase HalB n=1 Tax=Serratia plymuthica TaxID=82996 RepID=UPI00217B311D|nr:nucleotidyltransferase domain-containing protein [Serratia plymuthica]CAI1213870.1 Nucleotidyltransferase domain [Serratia plymuthica]